MNEIMTTLEVAQLLHVSTQTIINWRKSGKLKSYTRGRNRFFKRDDIDKQLIKQSQLQLDTAPRERPVKQLKFFERLNEKLTAQESFQFMFSFLPERDWHLLILSLATKYEMVIPSFFKKECRRLNITV